MKYTTASRWDSPATFTADQTYNRLIAMGAKEPSPEFLRDVIDTFYDVGPKVNLNADLMTAHCANETGKENVGTPFNSVIYMTRGVIDGLGVTDGEDQGLSFTSGRNAALAHLVHLFAYVHGAIPKRHPLYGYILFDPRYQLVLNGGHAGKVTTVKSMTGWWWTDSTGHTSVIKQANAIFNEFTSPVDHPPQGPGGPSMPTPTTKLVFGRVPVPELELHDIVTNGPNTAYALLGPRRDLGTCTHRMVGSLLGTHGYFQGEARERSLTDFGIGGPWDGANDGVAYQWIPKGFAGAPHSNGPANDLDGDGIAFVQTLGVNAVNRDIRSIELSDGGNINNPYGPTATAKQFAKHVAIVAYLFDQAEVPWDAFPLNPAVGVVTYLEHWELGPKECPFPPVRAQTNASQNAVRAILKLHQTGAGTTPTPIPPTKPIEVVPYSATLDQNFLRAQWGEPRRVYASGKAAVDKDTGKTKTYPWNPRWTPCSAWIHRAKRHNAFPSPGDWETIPGADAKKGEPTSMITFENGWTLLHFADARGWRWAGDETGDID